MPNEVAVTPGQAEVTNAQQILASPTTALTKLEPALVTEAELAGLRTNYPQAYAPSGAVGGNPSIACGDNDSPSF